MVERGETIEPIETPLLSRAEKEGTKAITHAWLEERLK
jgi:hypothetical protein